MPIDMPPNGKSTKCQIGADGIIAFPQHVVDHLGWQIEEPIVVSYLLDGSLLILLFRRAEPGACGFKLAFKNRTVEGGSGGKLRCRKLIKQIVSPLIPLTRRDIDPIFLDMDKKSGHKPYEMAFLLQIPGWTEVEFNANGVADLPQRLLGVYQIVNGNPDKPVRIGQGIVQARLKEHVKENDFRAGSHLAYFPVAKKKDAELVEHILLMQYKQENGGQLPPGNRITA